jgi:hypothetical protein
VSSLEGYGSTVELHPRDRSHYQWGVKDLNLRRHSHQIYSLAPLTARETPLGIFTREKIPPWWSDRGLGFFGTSSKVPYLILKTLFSQGVSVTS